ncbi:MAG: T9SS type A sorting domain-containing protein [Bacteroidetes bacterium]|nr:T9SS type A sorting domain-containing protein [Bacteroidota bacterium]
MSSPNPFTTTTLLVLNSNEAQSHQLSIFDVEGRILPARNPQRTKPFEFTNRNKLSSGFIYTM